MGRSPLVVEPVSPKDSAGGVSIVNGHDMTPRPREPLDVEHAFRTLGDSLTRFAATIVGSADARDVVATVFARILAGSPPMVDSPRSFLFRSVYNECLNQTRGAARRQERERRAIVHRPDAERSTKRSAEVESALSQLSPQQRSFVHLAYWEDMSPAQIADSVGVREGSVRKQLARARRKLREELSNDWRRGT